MKKPIILVFGLIVFLATIQLGLASKPIEIVPSSTNVILTTGEVETVTLNIKNNQPFDDTFTVSVFPSYLAGVSASLEKTMVSIGSNSEKNIELYFSAPLDTEQFMSAFTVTVKSLANTSIEETTKILLQTKRKSPVYISDIKLNKYALNPEEKLIIDVKVTNVDKKASEENYMLKTEIKKGNLTLQRFDDLVESIPARTTITKENSYVIGKYAEPGVYLINSYLKNSLNTVVASKSTTFKVNAIYKLPTDYTKKTTKIGFLTLTTTIVIKNEGNIESPSFFVTETLPSVARDLFISSIQPTYVNESNGRVIYSWLVPSLKPGQSIAIIYQINLLGVWVVILIIALAIYFVFEYSFRPTIVKSHKHFGPITREREIPIVLELKNKSRKEIKNIVVKDTVPAILRVVNKFQTVKPKIKKIKTGVELVWRFSSLKPREERILSYNVKPIIDIVGSIKLPKAEITYTDKNKKRKVAHSKRLIVNPR